MKSQRQKAEEFRALHHGDHILVLPNCWDVPSARVFEDAGFPAVATSSAGLMVSLGYPDGEVIGKGELLSVVAKIAKALSVPLSADVVAGFGETPKEVASTIRSIIEAGAVGINIEDFVHATKKLIPMEAQAEKLRAIKQLSQSMGVPLVINARTDALRYDPGDEVAKLEEAIRRAKAYRDVGADCVYPMGLTDAMSISKFVKALSFPVNVMVRPGLPSVRELERLGVARVSLGPTASYAAMGLLKRIAKELLEKGTYQTLLEGAITIDELNRLALPKAQ
ncbi:MAG: isocitrate lyase/phosphoenolpyruvate mutase family protein [Thaumarchaeota archaeon]|nr:isocitrate lyase/phosphoenolpyruvate mutase family protein [Nitrososphaerota archaeon]MBI3022722.1 isocitrate lyase/phosphoenolpyruvate mutase family protein [Nitrososphaerota archaeon]